MPYKLQNYLRTYRKRSSLSQDELAYLLGCRSGTKVSRYERSARKPTLETILAYTIVFGVSGRELFEGTFEKVEKKIKGRAGLLTRKLSRAKPTPTAARKLQILEAITSGSGTPPEKRKIGRSGQVYYRSKRLFQLLTPPARPACFVT